MTLQGRQELEMLIWAHDLRERERKEISIIPILQLKKFRSNVSTLMKKPGFVFSYHAKSKIATPNAWTV